MKLIKHVQGTPEWLQWRKGSDLPEGFAITATMAAAIAGTSPFITAYRLWQELTGREAPKPINRFMMAGSRNEPRARVLYETHIKESFSPECIESSKHPWVRASLDGLTMFHDRTVEIKCPGDGSHQEAVAGIIKLGYVDQMQWQMLSTDGAVTAGDFVSYFKYPDGREELIVIPVLADPARQQELFKMAEAFRQCLMNDVPPAGSEFEQAAHIWLVLDAQIKELETRESVAKQALIDLAPQGGQCPGVNVIVSNRKGSTKWQEVMKTVMALPEVAAVITKEQLEAVVSSNTGNGSSTVTVKTTSDAEAVLAIIMARSQVGSNTDEVTSTQVPDIVDSGDPDFSMNW